MNAIVTTSPSQRSHIVPVTMSMVGTHPMMGNSAGLPHVSGQLQNMQISSIGPNGAMMADASMMMDPLMPLNMGSVGNLDPQLQPGDGTGQQYTLSSMGHSPVTLHQQQIYQNDYGNSVGSGTSLTEFTKRRNWSQRLLEELQDFLHILTPEMKIVYASPSGKALTGYDAEELLGRVITDFIHADDSGLFIREFHESAATGHPLRMFYRFRKKDSTYTILETNGHPHFSEPHPHSMMQPMQPKGFFMMARQYPTKNAALLDSFLEYKIEHERLTRRIAELKKEELEDQQQQLRQRAQLQQQQQQQRLDGTPMHLADSGETPQYSLMPGVTGTPSSAMLPPSQLGSNNTLLTRQNLEMIDATTSRPDSIREKMARFEGHGPHETIEMLTGLRYREGERSRGISTGDTSPSLIRGDVGVPIPMDKENRHTGEKKKKQKIADEYVCTDCGTLDSPEWRKGPKGPKTLCNACGLRWAKKEKKKNQNAGNAAQSPICNPNMVTSHPIASPN